MIVLAVPEMYGYFVFLQNEMGLHFLRKSGCNTTMKLIYNGSKYYWSRPFVIDNNWCQLHGKCQELNQMRLLACIQIFCNTLVQSCCTGQEFEYTKGFIRVRISKKNRQHNGQKNKYKRTNNDLQNIHKTIPELVVPIRISLIEGCCKQGSYWTKGSS
jgi:hypothetical protein